MAANETEVNNIAGVEATVNRWIVDYYSHLALDFFKNKKYAEFCGIRDVLQSKYQTNSSCAFSLFDTDVVVNLTWSRKATLIRTCAILHCFRPFIFVDRLENEFGSRTC